MSGTIPYDCDDHVWHDRRWGDMATLLRTVGTSDPAHDGIAGLPNLSSHGTKGKTGAAAANPGGPRATRAGSQAFQALR